MLGALLVCGSAVAEVLDRSSPFIRIRLGDNTVGSTNLVIYNAGVPTSMGGLSGVTAAPQTISTNTVSGGSGAFTVRVVTDLNARNGVSPVQGTFSYDSAQPMTCTTAATCGGTTIPFSNISWTTRDNDTHTAVTRYDDTANQVIQVQTDTNVATVGDSNRHRNYFRYEFDNATLLPAGTYEGTITINGTGQF